LAQGETSTKYTNLSLAYKEISYTLEYLKLLNTHYKTLQQHLKKSYPLVSGITSDQATDTVNSYVKLAVDRNINLGKLLKDTFDTLLDHSSYTTKFVDNFETTLPTFWPLADTTGKYTYQQFNCMTTLNDTELSEMIGKDSLEDFGLNKFKQQLVQILKQMFLHKSRHWNKFSLISNFIDTIYPKMPIDPGQESLEMLKDTYLSGPGQDYSDLVQKFVDAIEEPLSDISNTAYSSLILLCDFVTREASQKQVKAYGDKGLKDLL
jgi:hypothetical protein